VTVPSVPLPASAGGGWPSAGRPGGGLAILWLARVVSAVGCDGSV